jgi:hypothetical protein
VVTVVPLVFKPVPFEVTEAARTGLNKIRSMRAFSTPRLSSIVSEEGARAPTQSQAIPIYDLGIKDLAEDRGLDAAIHTGWRFLISYDNEVIASADAYFDPDGKPIFAQVNEGPMVQGIVSGVQGARAEGEIGRGKYEVRLLIAPALYVAVLWLVDMIGDNDIAIPIAPTSNNLIINKPIPTNRLLTILQEASKDAL